MPDDSLETGLSSLGRHSTDATREPLWKKSVRTLVVYVVSLLTLLVLDIIWMKGIAPVLGVDYFAVVEVGRYIFLPAKDFSWNSLDASLSPVLSWRLTHAGYSLSFTCLILASRHDVL